MSQKSLKCHVYNFNAYAAPQAGKSFKVSSPAKVSILQQNCQNHFFATFINVDWGPYPIFVTCNICGAGVNFFSWSQRVKNECVFDVFWCRKSSFGVFFVYNFELKNVQWKWCWCEQNDKCHVCWVSKLTKSLPACHNLCQPQTAGTQSTWIQASFAFFVCFFSYASSSTLYPCQSVSD